jgi:hypothetical protein
MRPALLRLRSESGQGIVSALLLLAGVLLPLLFLVPLFARIEQGRLAAAQAARDAVRSAVEAADATSAQQAAQQALVRAQSETSDRLTLQLTGTFSRGSILRAETQAEIPLASLPLVGRFGTIVVHGAANAPIDRYRSLLTNGAP